MNPILRLLTLLSLPVCLQAESSHAPSLPYLTGADLSALPVYEAAGAVYRDAEGQPGDALQILADVGMRCVRLRLFVDPNMQGIVSNNLEYTLSLARRCQDAGLEILLNLHYSDTWADPSKQFTPAAWSHLPAEGLIERVQSYTHAVFHQFISSGIRISYVQLGNEITNGMLWPSGKVEFDGNPNQANNWQSFAALLHAAHQGLEQAYTASGQPIPKRFHHIECTGDLPRTAWYLRNLMRHHIPFDAVAFSYYPEWHGSLCDLRNTLHHASTQTGKPVIVVETAYPWHPESQETDRDVNLFPHALSPDGQAAFLADLDRLIRNLDGAMGRGLFYWHPESRRMEAPFHIWKWGRHALFDFDGTLLPGALSFRSNGQSIN